MPAFLPIIGVELGEPEPEPEPVQDEPASARAAGDVIQARISHYWPPLGGPNCSRFVSGQCISRMASGKPWQDYIDRACACPPEYPFGTVFVVDGQEWTCLDRGGKVKTVDGIPWLDLLTERAPVPYGTILQVEVMR